MVGFGREGCDRMEEKPSISPKSFIDEVVVPGDVILDLTTMNNQSIKLGGSLRQDCDAIVVTKSGRLRFSKPSKYWVESSQKRYVPSVEDHILGIVVDSKADARMKVSRNENITKLQVGYVFHEISRRKSEHMMKYPNAQVISLGLGDTTEPIPHVITSKAEALSVVHGYMGYGAEQGEKPLRTTIASALYRNHGIDVGDIYVSDGEKCNISRLQMLFGPNVTMAVQDPSYPAYVQSSVIMGQIAHYLKDAKKYGKIECMTGTPENGFFPDLSASHPQYHPPPSAAATTMPAESNPYVSSSPSRTSSSKKPCHRQKAAKAS